MALVVAPRTPSESTAKTKPPSNLISPERVCMNPRFDLVWVNLGYVNIAANFVRRKRIREVVVTGTDAISDAIEEDMRSETVDDSSLAAFTRLSRRVTRPGVLRPDPGRTGNPRARFNGLMSRALAVMVKL